MKTSVLQLQGDEFFQQPEGAWKWIFYLVKPLMGLQLQLTSVLEPKETLKEKTQLICSQTPDT